MDIDTDADGAREPVLRNHRYVFSITGMVSSGFPTPEEAENAASSDIEYTVTDWDMTVSDIWMTGNYYLRTSG